jgi:hypothetical protein
MEVVVAAEKDNTDPIGPIYLEVLHQQGLVFPCEPTWYMLKLVEHGFVHSLQRIMSSLLGRTLGPEQIVMVRGDFGWEPATDTNLEIRIYVPDTAQYQFKSSAIETVLTEGVRKTVKQNRRFTKVGPVIIVVRVMPPGALPASVRPPGDKPPS